MIEEIQHLCSLAGTIFKKNKGINGIKLITAYSANQYRDIVHIAKVDFFGDFKQSDLDRTPQVRQLEREADDIRVALSDSGEFDIAVHITKEWIVCQKQLSENTEQLLSWNSINQIDSENFSCSKRVIIYAREFSSAHEMMGPMTLSGSLAEFKKKKNRKRILKKIRLENGPSEIGECDFLYCMPDETMVSAYIKGEDRNRRIIFEFTAPVGSMELEEEGDI